MVVSKVLIFFATFILVKCQIDDPCTIPSGSTLTCLCDTGNGIIDLSSLAFNDGDPFFSEYDSNGGSNQYFYNPCHAFSEGFSYCSYGDASVCQDYGGDQASCGKTQSERIVNRNNEYYVLYGDGTDERKSEVRLICDEDAEIATFTPYGDSTVQLTYEFDLRTKCACPGACEGSTSPTDPDNPNPPSGNDNGGGIAPGIIGIVIMLLIPAALLSYFIIGAVIMKFKFEKTGTDIIPQKEFWISIPFLIKDGAVFTFRSFKGLIVKDKSVSYDNI